MAEPLKVLLVQLASNGDCLFVTAIARQIKELDYPGCKLTWLIGAPYKGVIENNPFVDEIVTVPIADSHDIAVQRSRIHTHIAHLNRQFDEVFITDYIDENESNWYGTTRTSLFRSYPKKVQRAEPFLFLTKEEKANVKSFAGKHGLGRDAFCILFECSPQSGQSSMTFEKANAIATKLVKRFPHLKIILSSRNKFHSCNENIIDGSPITWRENAELTKYCQLLVGCSSGISWLNTTNASAKIPMVQMINPNYFKTRLTASLKIDFQYFGLSTEKLIERHDTSDEKLFNCICTVIEKGFLAAKKEYEFVPLVSYGGQLFLADVVKKGSYLKGNIENLQLLVYLILAGINNKTSKYKFVIKSKNLLKKMVSR